MAFRTEDDVEIARIGTFATAKGGVAVRLMSYDGGAVKIAILRVREGEDGEQTTKLGRLTADEAEGIAPLLVAAAVALREHAEAVAVALAAAKKK